ncbi:maternal protein tudor [Drosophila serrata]|uniref:maternal protein tudor n=1 Tax=Drosophila serrata TaxID=7274 RepID=UPI000A1D0B13|nr:maternal protein tudor [Drosophila serrata]
MNGQAPSVGASNLDLYITHLDHVGPYLKVYGQVNHDAAILVSKGIEQVLPACFSIEPSWSVERQQALLISGVICAYKRTNGPAPGDVDYMRVRVISAELEGQQMRAEIEFLDYGFKRTVKGKDLIFPKTPKLMQNIPLLCSQYIVLGICHDWGQGDLGIVHQLIVNQTVKLAIDATQICGQKFASLRWKDFRLDEFLVQQRKIGAPVAKQLMLDHCRKLWKDAPQTPLAEHNNNTIYSNSMTPTDIAREQLASRRSLSARLEAQRSVQVTSPPRPLNAEAAEYAPKQTPLANVTNVQMLSQGLANTQKPAYVPANPYNRANYQPAAPAAQPYVPKASATPRYNYYNVRLNQPAPQKVVPLNNHLVNYPQMSYAPARFTPPPTPTASGHRTQQRAIPAFRTTSLTVGLTYDVYMSYVENAVHLFWVQLKSSLNDLTAMMGKIEKTHLKPLLQAPEIGSACVARFADDGNLYRALVSGISGQRFRVVYVDYGNSGLLLISDLFQIPAELLEIKPFAYRFALAGTKEIEPIDESMRRIFKELCTYRNFQLTVHAPESVGAMQTCHLMQNGFNMLEKLRQMKNTRLSYTKAEQLQNDDEVEIRYIDSPSNFYVQKVVNVEKFGKLMDEMFSYYNANQRVPEQLILGAPCMVRCDQEWYRAEVLRVDDTVIVRHVDFGYEQVVKRHCIGNIAEKHLEMPRQAVKCCLKGFENSDLGKDKITDQFEMLAEDSNIQRRTFNVRVFRIEPDGLTVVNLIAKNLNVMKKLYKLSMPFEKYLTLEKGHFNTTHTESIVSSELDKSNVLNSTSIVEIVDRVPSKEKQQKQLKDPVLDSGKGNSKTSGDWDKRSSTSASSKDSRRQQQQQQQPNERFDRHLDSSFDTQSISSYVSGISSPRKGKRQQNGRLQTQSPKLQNGKQEANKNTRFSQNESPRKTQDDQQKNQRSQNAPQGFAQKPQRQKSTLDGNAVSSSKRSSGVESDAASSSTESKPEKYVPLDKPYVQPEIKTPSKEAASLSWWVSPFQFYIVPKSLAAKYDGVLREMRQFYRQKQHQPLQLKVGSTVVVRQRKDNAILRATIIGCNHMIRKYRVFCVDTGSLITVTSEDVWPLEQRFADIPCLAQRCTFDSVVANYDPLYIVDRMEKYVPVNAMVECEFLYKERIGNNHGSQNGCTYTINIFVNGVSLQKTLIKAELLSEVAPEVRVRLLAGQQIRGRFSFIRDMTSFKVQLDYCDYVNFMCSYDDAKFVKSNPDLARRFKEFYEGKSFAFNIKNVCENNIIYLRPVMPLFMEDRKAFICPYPVVLSSFQALVAFTSKPYRIFVQNLSTDGTINNLLDDMYEFYETQGVPLKKYESGQICAARSSDNNWYRARICGRDSTAASTEVFYIDYGNTELVKREDIRALDDKFFESSSGFAIEVNLPIGRPNDADKLKTRVAELLEAKAVTIKAIEVRRNHLIADVFMENDESVVEILKAEKLIPGRDLDYMRKQLEKGKSRIYEYIETVDLTSDDEEEKRRSSKLSSPKKKQQNDREPKKTKPVAAPTPSPATAPSPVPAKAPTPIPVDPKPASPVPVAVKEPEPKTVVQPQPEPQPEPEPESVQKPVKITPPEEDPFKDMEKAVLSHCDNPAHFFVHPVDRLPEVNRLQENLQIVSPSLPQLRNVVNGADCISLYSVDKNWYRSKIIDAELMVLQFVDFGNTDCVSDTSDVRESMWSHIEPFCVPCALPIRPKNTADWVDAANGIFNESYTKHIRYEYLTQGDHQTVSYVNLFIDGEDVAKKLIADGFALPLEYVASGCTCYISHVNGICDFYIQLERDSKALELIEMFLRDEEKLKPLEKFEKGAIVAALFEDDELWYRAQLLKQLPDSRYEVLFIDYGNTSTTSKCLQLSEEIAKLPSLSKKCSLQLPEDYTSWSPEAEAKFAELTGEGELIFTTQLVKPGQDHVTIQLLLDGENINDRLLPLCPRKEPKAASKESLTEGSSPKTKAVVTHVGSPTELYLQFSEKEPLLEIIIEKLNDGTLQPKKEKGQLDELLVAQYDEDMEFYRVRILEVLDDDKYRVIFIDYGNPSVVDKLYDMPEEFKTIPAIAEICRIESCADFEKNKKLTQVNIQALLDCCNGDVVVEFIDKSVSPALVRLTTNDKKGLNICEQLQKVLKTELTIIQKRNENSECVISHGNSPKSFYVQLKNNLPELDVIVKTLRALSKDHLQVFKAPPKDYNGICYSQEDACFYRCSVKSSLEDHKGYEAFLLDYGNTITVPEIWKLPQGIEQIEPQALHCQLSELPADVPDEKLEQAFVALLEQHFGEVYQITTQPREDESKPLLAKLCINYKDFAQELASTVAGVQKPLEAELHNCFVVQYDGPTSFYVQMESEVPELEKMTDKLLDAEQDWPVFSDLKEGALCVAQFPQDEVFYRAEIIKVLEDNKCEVHFIDFGNNALTQQFRQLPEELAKPKRFSKHCELEAATISKCDVAQLQTFIDTRCSETFQVEILATKGEGTNVVRLFYQSTNITEKLQSLQQEEP